jgi:hypothetical protein
MSVSTFKTELFFMITGMIFFCYLIDFIFFFVKKKFQKLQGTVRTGQKSHFYKRGVDGFSYFH